MRSTETLPLVFDATNLLAAGETPSSPYALLTDLYTKEVYAAGLSGNPTVSGDDITQTVTGLQPGRNYRLAITFTAAAGKIWTMILNLECPDT